MRRTIAFLTGFAVVAVAAVALGVVRDTGSHRSGTNGSGAIDQPPATANYPIASYPFAGHERDQDLAESLEVETAEDKPPSNETEARDQEPDDLTPPPLAILHPTDGQVFSTKEVVFEGTTEVGARVFAGEYEADVRDDGSWRIVLFLSPGHNLATFIAKDAAGNVTDARVTAVLEAIEEEKPEHEKEFEGEFSAHQQFGECSENPPFDVFYGTGRPGTRIVVASEFGDGETEVNESGHWEIKVIFPEAPVGLTFLVKVKEAEGASQAFEFTRTG